mgnify:CR=1 FL=1
MAEVKTGTIKWYNTDKGFGFISGTDGAKDLFVHASEIQNNATLNDGDTVSYTEETTPKGLQAKDVTKDN